MKHEWRKQEKEYYGTQKEPRQITVPNWNYFMIQGKGNPNEADFSERVGVLYSLAYAVRMMPKSGVTPEGYFEYAVYPLEGVWESCDVAEKSSYSYTIMIRQPDFVTEEIAEEAFRIAAKKKLHPFLKEARFGGMEDGLSVQILHEGDYDLEPASFQKLDGYLAENGLERRGESHREIYLTNAKKGERSKMKTLLRYCVREKGDCVR